MVPASEAVPPCTCRLCWSTWPHAIHVCFNAVQHRKQRMMKPEAHEAQASTNFDSRCVLPDGLWLVVETVKEEIVWNTQIVLQAEEQAGRQKVRQKRSARKQSDKDGDAKEAGEGSETACWQGNRRVRSELMYRLQMTRSLCCVLGAVLPAAGTPSGSSAMDCSSGRPAAKRAMRAVEARLTPPCCCSTCCL